MSKYEFRLAKKETIWKGNTCTTFGIVEYDIDQHDVTDFRDPNNWSELEDLKGTLEMMVAACDKPLLGTFAASGEFLFEGSMDVDTNK